MYRFLLRPKWIAFTLLCLAGVLGMLWLAQWQWNRYQERNEFVDSVSVKQKAEPQDLTSLLATDSPAEIAYYRVTARGSYTDGQLIAINQTQNGDAGIDVLTPFQIDGGPVVIVNRGFVADGAVVPPPPSGELVIGGTARTTQIRRTGELTDNQSGTSTEVRRVDLPLIAQRLGVDVAPVYIDFIASEPASPPPPEPVPPPDLSGGPPHLSYTIQWCIFSVCVIVGWVFAVRRSGRRRAKAAAAKSSEPADSAVTEDGSRAVPSA